MPLFKYQYPNNMHREFEKVMTPALNIPVNYEDKPMCATDIRPELGYIILEIPEDLIARIQAEKVVVHSLRTPIRIGETESERTEQIDSIEITDQ